MTAGDRCLLCGQVRCNRFLPLLGLNCYREWMAAKRVVNRLTPNEFEAAFGVGGGAKIGAPRDTEDTAKSWIHRKGPDRRAWR